MNYLFLEKSMRITKAVIFYTYISTTHQSQGKVFLYLSLSLAFVHVWPFFKRMDGKIGVFSHLNKGKDSCKGCAVYCENCKAEGLSGLGEAPSSSVFSS